MGRFCRIVTYPTPLLPVRPSLRSKLRSVLAPEIFPPVQRRNVEIDGCVRGDEDGGEGLRAAAEGEDGVFEGDAGVVGEGWVEAECCECL